MIMYTSFLTQQRSHFITHAFSNSFCVTPCAATVGKCNDECSSLNMFTEASRGTCTGGDGTGQSVSQVL